jgi:NAD(P)-dependent dehydrogenase (short-subunit alcohol dehydrogenase family)
MSESNAGMRFKNTVAIVTGSTHSPSIGRSTATRLAREGASVVINGRSPDAVELAQKEMQAEGLKVVGVAGSMEDDGLAERLVATAVKEFGPVTAVVNTVGGAPGIESGRTMTKEMFLGTVALNTWPSIELVQIALKNGLSANKGAVVFVSSGTTHMTTPTMIAYKAGKSALNAVTATLARDLGALGIRVNAVAPGMTFTTATQSLLDGPFAKAGDDHPLRRLPHADDIADVACFLLSQDALMVTGQVIDVDAGAHLVGGWSPYTPPAED